MEILDFQRPLFHWTPRPQSAACPNENHCRFDLQILLTVEWKQLSQAARVKSTEISVRVLLYLPAIDSHRFRACLCCEYQATLTTG